MHTWKDTWNQWYADTMTTLSDPHFYMDKIWILIKIILLLVAARIVIRIGRVTIERIFTGKAVRMNERRSRTLSVLMSNVLRYAVYFFITLTILEQLNFKIGTLLAGAGIAGLAIGFGAQNFVRDVITGFFIIFEDQFAVGDTVQTGKYQGTVEEIGLRITKIRAWTGEMHYIPNGSISEVTNFSKANSLAVVDVGVAYEENLERVFGVLQEVLAKAKSEMDAIVSEPQVLGVQAFGPSEVTVRIIADCKPTENAPISRELRRRIKEAFQEKGIGFGNA